MSANDDLLLELGAFVADYYDGLLIFRSWNQTREQAEKLIARVNEAIEQDSPVFQVTRKDVLDVLYRLGAEQYEIEDVEMYVRNRLENIVTRELWDIAEVYLKEVPQ